MVKHDIRYLTDVIQTSRRQYPILHDGHRPTGYEAKENWKFGKPKPDMTTVVDAGKHVYVIWKLAPAFSRICVRMSSCIDWGCACVSLCAYIGSSCNFVEEALLLGRLLYRHLQLQMPSIMGLHEDSKASYNSKA